MEQEPILVRLDSSFGFKPVLQQSQRTRPRKQFRKDSPDKRPDMQPAKNRVRARQQSTEDYPQNEQRMQDEDGNRECRIEIRSEDGCMHLLNLPQRQLAMGLMDIRRFWGPRIVLLPEDCAKNHSCRHG